MPSIDDVKVKVSTEADNKGIDEAEQRIAGFSTKTIDASKKIALGVAGIGIAAGAMALSFVGDFSAQEDALVRLQTGLKNVHSETDKTTADLEAYATSLQKTTRFADEQILSADAMLTTFQLNKTTIKSLTPGMLDMAEAMRKTTGETVDLNQLSIMFGKVMGNAEGGVEGMAGGLKKLGVIMTEEQKAVFEFGTEAERAATLSQIMSENFAGQATAAAGTFSGKMDIMQNQIGEVKEAIGGMVAEALTPLVNYIATNVVPIFEKIVNWLKEHETIAKTLAIVLGVVLVAAFVALGIAAVTSIASIIIAAAPILLIVAAIAAVVAALYLAWQKNFLGIRDIVSAVVAWFTGTAVPFVKGAIDNVIKFATNLKTTWDNVWQGIKDVTKMVIDSIVGFVKGMINTVINGINALIRGINKVGGKVPGMPKEILGEIPNFATGVSNFRGGMAMVGERGPELVTLPRGSSVIPNDQLGQGFAPAVINQTNNIYNQIDMEVALREIGFKLGR